MHINEKFEKGLFVMAFVLPLLFCLLSYNDSVKIKTKISINDFENKDDSDIVYQIDVFNINNIDESVNFYILDSEVENLAVRYPLDNGLLHVEGYCYKIGEQIIYKNSQFCLISDYGEVWIIPTISNELNGDDINNAVDVNSGIKSSADVSKLRGTYRLGIIYNNYRYNKIEDSILVDTGKEIVL